MLEIFRVPWTARRSSQLILKEISPEDSLEGLVLKPKLQYFGHLMWRTDSSEKTLMLGKIEGRRKRGRQSMRWLDGITDLMDTVWATSGSWWWIGKLGVLQSMGLQRVGHDWVTEQNWVLLRLLMRARCHSEGLHYITEILKLEIWSLCRKLIVVNLPEWNVNSKLWDDKYLIII